MAPHKSLALAAALALSTAGLVACSGGDDGSDSGGNVTMQLWENATTGPGKAFWEKVAADYHTAHPTVTIKIQTVQNEDLDGKLQTALNSGSAPDMFLQRGGGKMAAMVEAGQLKDLTDDLTAETKAAVGDHDENVSFDVVVTQVGEDLANAVREATLEIYAFAAAYAAERGVIIADTKLEFGTDEHGVLHVMDEMLTPDSSRFWPADEYQVGISPPSYDKQFVRDYLEQIGWNKTPPAPKVPTEVIDGTAAKYAEALDKLAGIRLD